MAELFLHIGSNKTATTTLQYRLSRSAETLSAAGLLYPKVGQSEVGAHHYLAGHLCSNPPQLFAPVGALEPLLDALSTELAEAGDTSEKTRVIISSEMLFWFRVVDTEALKRLLTLFSGVKVIAYLRRQDAYLPSHYSSMVNNGVLPQSFEQFCSDINLNYLKNLNAWADLVGAENVVARPFAREFWTGGDIASDFLHRVGSVLTTDDLVESEPKNQALCAETIEVLVATGAATSRVRFPEFRDAVQRHFEAIGGTASQRLMTPAILERLHERYAEKNRRLVEKYFSAEESAALEFPVQQVDDTTDPKPLQQSDYAALVGSIWDHQQSQLDDAREQNRQLWEQLQDLEERFNNQGADLREQHLLGEAYRQKIREQSDCLSAWELELQSLRERIRAYEEAEARRKAPWRFLVGVIGRCRTLALGMWQGSPGQGAPRRPSWLNHSD